MKKKKLVIFRTAGGKASNEQLGLGHIFRTINLANELRKTCKVHFIVEDFGGAEKILKSYRFSIKKIPKNVNLKDDIKITNKLIKQKNADLLIIDRYNIKKSYLKKIKNKIKTILITDLKNIDYDVELIVNGFIGFENKIIKNQYKTKCLLGPHYQILNKKFETRKTKKNSKIRILITFGGYDEKQITDLISNSLKEFINKVEFKIILGPVTKISKNLMVLGKKYPNNIIIQKNVKNMHKEILESSFGICSGGLTTYEFATVGIPFAIICDEKHQLITAKQWEGKKIAVNLGLVNKNTKKNVNKVIEKFLKKEMKFKSGRKFVDGFGTKRVSNEILKI